LLRSPRCSGGKIAAIIVEEEHYDLRHEGSSSYCPINHIIRMIIDTVMQNYDYTVIECEAGLRHLSRRRTWDVDVMLVILDTTSMSLKPARRLKKIAEEINVDLKKLINIRNKIPSGAG